MLTISMIKTIIGIVLVLIGLYLIKIYKTFRWIPAPEGHPDIRETIFDYRRIMLGAILIGGGLLLIFN